MKKILFFSLFLLFTFFISIEASQKNNNPHQAQWLDKSMIESLSSLTRVDSNGILYKMDCLHDYYCPSIINILEQISAPQIGCSAFFTFNVNNEPLTCRNYEYRHKKLNDSNGEYTGLNVVINCEPKGKYKSLAIADACWLDVKNGTFYSGVLDDEKTDVSLLALLPYICMDGINEKGLVVSILLLDVKDGETTVAQNESKKKTIVHTVLMRYILDNCKNISEAIDMAKKYNIKSPAETDFHIFVTDAKGKSVVLEWRYNKLYVTQTNVVTNFYVGFDDAQDYYDKGVFKENFIKLDNTIKQYKYGYGHGYHRFTGILSTLERYIDKTNKEYKTIMTDTQARDILRCASQEPSTEKTSMTQYSVIYNAKKLSASIWVFRDYDTQYNFEIK